MVEAEHNFLSLINLMQDLEPSQRLNLEQETRIPTSRKYMKVRIKNITKHMYTTSLRKLKTNIHL